jgi:predicted regulator of Ras-like GTPase activity (Roadblock/LC7/MglB family)
VEENTKEQLAPILHRLRENNPGMEGAVLISPDGLLLAEGFSEDELSEKVLTVISALLRLGEQYDAVVTNGGYDEMHLKGLGKSFILYRAGDAVLAVRIGPEASTGMIALEARQAAREIGLVLSGALPNH